MPWRGQPGQRTGRAHDFAGFRVSGRGQTHPADDRWSVARSTRGHVRRRRRRAERLSSPRTEATAGARHDSRVPHPRRPAAHEAACVATYRGCG
ncbi:hypothetical protein ACFPRL_10145 [Pseudoclavibacter helvolus]